MLYRQKIASVWIRNLSRGLNRVQETGSRNVKRVEVIDLVTSYHPQVHFSTGQFPPNSTGAPTYLFQTQTIYTARKNINTMKNY